MKENHLTQTTTNLEPSNFKINLVPTEKTIADPEEDDDSSIVLLPK